MDGDQPGCAISHAEREVVDRALRVGPTEPISEVLLASVEKLKVVWRCTCGCDSIGFEKSALLQQSKVLADCIGQTNDGEPVGVVVFGGLEEVSGLEVIGFADRPGRLPHADTIRPFDGYRIEGAV